MKIIVGFPALRTLKSVSGMVDKVKKEEETVVTV